jgi:chromosome segregation protein
MIKRGIVMTQITKLSCKGFKSFAKKTDISLLPGFNTIIGPNGNGKCARGNTFICSQSQGRTTIRKFVEKMIQESAQLKTLPDGVYVDLREEYIQAINPATMKAELSKVVKAVRREGDPILFECALKSGKKFTGTGCHPMMIFDPMKGGMVTKTLSKLSKGEKLAAPRLVQGNFEYHDPELARLLGYIIGDGSVTGGQIYFVNADDELLKDYLILMKQIFNIKKVNIYNKGKANSIVFSNKKTFATLSRFFNNRILRKKTIKKNIPPQFFIADNETVGNLLAALYDTDGHVHKRGLHIEFCNKNEQLVKDIQYLLLRFGIQSFKKEKIKWATNTEAKTKRKYYSLYIYGKENFRLFKKHIPLRVQRKKEALEIGIRKGKSNLNSDLLPRGANQTIALLVQLLSLKIKHLKKEWPSLTAYVENRCCASREQVDNILNMFIDRWWNLYALQLEGENYSVLKQIEIMDELCISGNQTEKVLQIYKSKIKDSWANGKALPDAYTYGLFYNYIHKQLANRLKDAKKAILLLHQLVSSDIYWDEIVSIKKVKGEKYVYDLTVEGNHTYIAEGLYVHNSNVVDAICFVLGKSSAKGLRADKSANLIYNGGKKGKPSKEAEVSIYFDNKKKTFPVDQKEVKVTRIVNQKGSSIYKINDKKLTRQQMLDIMRAARIDPDGHNIVLQGDIVRFTDMRPIERREVIEDVAGISVFEQKKQKAMGELNRVQDRLNEAEIILTEREKTLKDLKKDRDQALQYKQYEENIGRNKATKIHLMLKDRKENLDEQEKKFLHLEKEINRVQEEIDNLKQQITDKKKDIDAINVELNEKGDKRQRELQKEIEVLKTQVIKDTSRKDVIENELRKLKERKCGLENQVKEHDKKIDQLEQKKVRIAKKKEGLQEKETTLNHKVTSYKEKHGISDKDEISKKVAHLDNEVENIQRMLLGKEEEKQQVVRQQDRTQYELESIDQQVEKIELLKKEDEDKFRKLKSNRQEFKMVTKKLSETLNESGVFSTQLSTARTRLMDSNDEFARLRTKSISIREMSKGDMAIKDILSMEIPGVYGTVGDLGQVSGNYALALEVAAGPRMKSVVVSSDQVAAKCIKILKERKSGVVTFLPLNKIRERVIRPEDKKVGDLPGAHGLAIDLVKYDSKFTNVFKYVFAGTVVVENINTTRKIGIGRTRMVTLEGDLVEGSGAMVGGYRRKSGGLGFQQKEVNEKMTQLELDISRLQKTVSLLEDKKMDNEESIIRLRERKSVLEAQIKAAEVKIGGTEDIKELREKKRELKERHKAFAFSIKEFEKEVKELALVLKSLKEERGREREKLAKLTSSVVTQDLEMFQTQRQEIVESIIKIDSEVGAIINEVRLYSGEIEKTNQILKTNSKEFEEFTSELKGLNEDLTGNKDILKIKEINQKKFYAEYKGLFNKRSKSEKDIQKIDGVLIRREEQIRSIEGKRNEVSIKKAILSGEVEGLQKEFEQFKDVSLRRGITLQDLEVEIKETERALRNMGNVNLRALEIYEKVNEEYKLLLDKFDTLKLEKEEVLKLMYEIESKKQDSFMKTFNLLERNFREIFASLSAKESEAELVVESPESVFEGGIDIRVRIVGSKYLDLKSLSGGEKTMAALSFLFAIQEFEPSWFYLMDEVDAALDKRNSELLSQLIAKYSKGSQYIVVTHNDSVISEAQTIYGVSMQNGMSKVVSLKV